MAKMKQERMVIKFVLNSYFESCPSLFPFPLTKWDNIQCCQNKRAEVTERRQVGDIETVKQNDWYVCWGPNVGIWDFQFLFE